MNAARVKSVIALVVMLCSAGALYLVFNPIPPKPSTRAYQLLGEGVAREAAKLAAGGKVHLVTLDTSANPNPCLAAQLSGFVAAAKTAGLVIAATNTFKLDPLRPIRAAPQPFFDTFRKASAGDLVVSFVGPPTLLGEQRAKLPEKLARVLAVCPGDMPRQFALKPMFDAALVQAVVIEKPRVNIIAAAETGAAFDGLYQVITTANVADLPSPALGAAF